MDRPTAPEPRSNLGHSLKWGTRERPAQPRLSTEPTASSTACGGVYPEPEALSTMELSLSEDRETVRKVSTVIPSCHREVTEHAVNYQSPDMRMSRPCLKGWVSHLPWIKVSQLLGLKPGVVYAWSPTQCAEWFEALALAPWLLGELTGHNLCFCNRET